MGLCLSCEDVSAMRSASVEPEVRPSPTPTMVTTAMVTTSSSESQGMLSAASFPSSDSDLNSNPTLPLAARTSSSTTTSTSTTTTTRRRGILKSPSSMSATSSSSSDRKSSSFFSTGRHMVASLLVPSALLKRGMAPGSSVSERQRALAEANANAWTTGLLPMVDRRQWRRHSLIKCVHFEESQKESVSESSTTADSSVSATKSPSTTEKSLDEKSVVHLPSLKLRRWRAYGHVVGLVASPFLPGLTRSTSDPELSQVNVEDYEGAVGGLQVDRAGLVVDRVGDDQTYHHVGGDVDSLLLLRQAKERREAAFREDRS